MNAIPHWKSLMAFTAEAIFFLPELYNMTLGICRWCYEHKHDFVKAFLFFQHDWVFHNRYSAAIMAIKAAVNEITSSRSFWCPHFAVCGNGAMRLNFTLQDDVINPDMMSVSFPSPQLIQCRNHYFFSCGYWNCKLPLSPAVPTLPLHENGAMRHNILRDDVMNTDTMLSSFPACLGLPQLIQCSNGYIVRS